MIVKLKTRHSGYPDLSGDQSYFVIGIEADDYRIMNDAGKPYLYPPELFDVVDARYPLDWVTEFGDDGEQYSYPEPLNAMGFFEDFFEQKPKQISMFWHIVNRTLAKAA
ncbi:MAG: hypothetical protein KJO08_09685 [Gammaproteobacteria bacterium]|nr:hypothetical protein [Gammaproteobacteria bacterium]NNJ83649.1 hypothetical protein [Gammaproteobacteria bacterium]